MQYEAFTHALTEGLEGDARVRGLVAVGSMAAVDYFPDAYSDHDFLVVVGDGTQEGLRTDLSWLPRHDEIVLSFRETEHGLKVLYGDAHMLEFAVFDLEELGLASINRYRVLIDRGGIEERVRELVGRPRTDSSDEYLFGQLVTNVHVSLGRTARGELLSGRDFHVWARRRLCALIARVVPSEHRGLLDEFEPFRRFERVYPELGAEIVAAEPLDLLRIAQRELRPHRPDLPWVGLEAVLLEQA